MARPSYGPRDWMNATTPPTSAAVPAALEADGYAVRDPLTSIQLNRHLFELWDWIGHLDSDIGQPFAVEHYDAAATDPLGNAIAAGSHKAITCDSLSIRAEGNGANQGGTLSFPQAGGASNNTAVIELGVIGSGDCILALDHPATNAIELELRGGVWRSGLQGSATWAFEVNSGADEDLYIRNIGAGNANVDIDGNTNLQGTLDVAGLTSADAGVSVSAVATENSFVRYDAVQTFELDVSPYGGGWVAQEEDGGGAPDRVNHVTGTPPYVTPGSTTYVPLWRPLVLPVNTTTALDASARRAITQVKLRYYRVAGADGLRFELVAVARDGSGGESTVFAYDESTEFATTGAWTQYDSGAISHTLVPSSNYYFLRIVMNPNSTGGVRVADVMVEYTERHIQAPGM